MSHQHSERDILVCVCESPISQQRKEDEHYFPCVTDSRLTAGRDGIFCGVSGIHALAITELSYFDV